MTLGSSERTIQILTLTYTKQEPRLHHIRFADLGIDKFDNIYVTDPQSDPGCSHKAAVKKFDSSGNFITQREIEGEGNDLDPAHLAIDLKGIVYVSERTGGQIQVYTPVEK